MPSYSPRHFTPGSPPPPLRSARLLDQLRERIRHDHSSLKTGDIRRVQEWLWHPDVSTTMIYKHVLGSSAAGLALPLDSLHCAELAAACLH